jgi:hypothetical protein
MEPRLRILELPEIRRTLVHAGTIDLVGGAPIAIAAGDFTGLVENLSMAESRCWRSL